ncbi:MAG: hypothetical protein AAF532_02820 [Planctomycetota bacterium]
MAERDHDILLEELQRIRVTLEGLRVTLSTLTEIGADHERRLRVVERRLHSWAAVLAAAVFVSGAVASFMVERVFAGDPAPTGGPTDVREG